MERLLAAGVGSLTPVSLTRPFFPHSYQSCGAPNGGVADAGGPRRVGKEMKS